MIDFIADVHGYADKLEWLLCKMGYEKKGGTYKHQERTVLFVGDYIDRGPDNPGVVSIVRKMVDAGSAQALMGNHEYNAIMFNMLGDNSYLRPHTIKNFKQHSDTLLQFLGKQEKYDEMITWFKTLPMYIEGNGFRAVHASWDNNSIHILKSQTINGVLTEEQFVESANAEAAIHQAVEITSKGLEVELPEGNSFKDKDGTERFNIRIKWWENPQGKNYEAMSVIEDITIEDKAFDLDFNQYKETEVPVFFGHYWLKGKPALLKPNVCCLDYSVAKGGYLTAYRWDGERVLNSEKLIWV